MEEQYMSWTQLAKIYTDATYPSVEYLFFSPNGQNSLCPLTPSYHSFLVEKLQLLTVV